MSYHGVRHCVFKRASETGRISPRGLFEECLARVEAKNLVVDRYTLGERLDTAIGELLVNTGGDYEYTENGELLLGPRGRSVARRLYLEAEKERVEKCRRGTVLCYYYLV